MQPSPLIVNGSSVSVVADGETPLLDVALPAGKHTLKLVNDEKHLEKRIEIDIKPGQPLSQRVKLDDP